MAAGLALFHAVGIEAVEVGRGVQSAVGDMPHPGIRGLAGDGCGKVDFVVGGPDAGPDDQMHVVGVAPAGAGHFGDCSGDNVEGGTLAAGMHQGNDFSFGVDEIHGGAVGDANDEGEIGDISNEGIDAGDDGVGLEYAADFAIRTVDLLCLDPKGGGETLPGQGLGRFSHTRGDAGFTSCKQVVHG